MFVFEIKRWNYYEQTDCSNFAIVVCKCVCLWHSFVVHKRQNIREQWGTNSNLIIMLVTINVFWATISQRKKRIAMQQKIFLIELLCVELREKEETN